MTGEPSHGSALAPTEHRRRARHLVFWRLVNPVNPQVRVRLRRHWYDGRATLEPYDPAVVRRFNRYARMGPALLGIEPALVRVELG